MWNCREIRVKWVFPQFNASTATWHHGRVSFSRLFYPGDLFMALWYSRMVYIITKSGSSLKEQLNCSCLVFFFYCVFDYIFFFKQNILLIILHQYIKAWNIYQNINSLICLVKMKKINVRDKIFIFIFLWRERFLTYIFHNFLYICNVLTLYFWRYFFLCIDCNLYIQWIIEFYLNWNFEEKLFSTGTALSFK